MDQVIQEIENQRVQLIELARKKGFHDKEVLNLSVKLDKLINLFYLQQEKVTEYIDSAKKSPGLVREVPIVIGW
ncbi:MAG: Spo0E family sporulation regulatory protein-aspartic acid phosphatase [Chitinophagales bacterium]